MRAALLRAPGDVVVGEFSLPPLESGQVQMAVAQSALCGSEIDPFTGKAALGDPEAPGEPHRKIGHEFAGHLQELNGYARTRDAWGQMVTLQEGDYVAAWRGGKDWGSSWGLAEEAIVWAQHCVPVAAGVQWPALTEPLMCVVNTVTKTNPQLGDNVVVVGATGFMGDLLLQLLGRRRDLGSLIVTGRRPEGLRRAAAHGATHVVNTAGLSHEDASGHLNDLVANISKGRGADVVYELTGVQGGFDLACHVPLAEETGQSAIAGYHQDHDGVRAFPAQRWNWSGGDMRNCHWRIPETTVMPGMRMAMRLLAEGRVDVSGLVTHRFPLAAIGDAFELAERRPEGFMKAMIEPHKA